MSKLVVAILAITVTITLYRLAEAEDNDEEECEDAPKDADCKLLLNQFCNLPKIIIVFVMPSQSIQYKRVIRVLGCEL